MCPAHKVLVHKRRPIRGRRLLFSAIVFLFLAGSCAQPPVAAENLLLTPELSNPTATPFQPSNGTHSSLYDAPTSTPTVVRTPLPISTILAEVSRVAPTPYPGSLENIPGVVPHTSINPLTGLQAENPGLLKRRPIAVKVTLFPRYVRPQSGLTLADVVYEYYIEDGLTRFIAVFYGNDAPEVGPVRSGRFFDEHIARMYQAFFVFKYADPRAYDYFKDGDLADYLVVPGNGPCPPFFVGKDDREVYNNVFFNTVKFKDCISKRVGVDNSRPSVRSNFFSLLLPNTTEQAVRIYMRYSAEDYSYWQYDTGTNEYYRFQEINTARNGKPEAYEPLTDALSGEQVKADNVVVLFVPHIFANQFDEEDEVYHIDLFGSGPAYVFRDGLVVDANWRRTQLDQPLLLTSSLGAPLYLKPGVTFYQVISTQSESWKEGADWHFNWQAP